MTKDKERRTIEKATGRRAGHKTTSTTNPQRAPSNAEDGKLENPRKSNGKLWSQVLGGGNTKPELRTSESTNGTSNSSPSSPTFTSPQEAPADGDAKSRTEAPEEECSLFVGDLSRLVTEDMLRQAFSQYGEVVNVDIKRDKITRNTLGYGFIQFKKRSNAQQAFALDGTEIGSRKIRIGWAQKITSLFLGDLDDQITTDTLQQIFSSYGPIVFDETYVKKNKYGFVKFKYRAHAEKAKAELDGKPLCDTHGKVIGLGRPVRIGWGDANTQRNCVHVQFEAGQCMAQGLTEDDFREQFKLYGKVSKVSLPRYADKRLKGYGFVHFEDNENGERSAARAITTLSGKEIKGVRIQCNFGKRQVSNGDVPNRYQTNNANQPDIMALLSDPVYFGQLQKMMSQQGLMGATPLMNNAMMNPLSHLNNSLNNLSLGGAYAGSMGVNWLTNLAAYQQNLLNLHLLATQQGGATQSPAAGYPNWAQGMMMSPEPRDAAIAGIYPAGAAVPRSSGYQGMRKPYPQEQYYQNDPAYDGRHWMNNRQSGYQRSAGGPRRGESPRAFPPQSMVYPPMNEDVYANDMTPTPPPEVGRRSSTDQYLDFLNKSENRVAGDQRGQGGPDRNRRAFFRY